MTLTKHRRRRDVRFLGLFDRQAHGALVDDIAEAPVPVDNRGGRRFLNDFPGRARHDVADFDALYIGRDLDDSVRVMAGEVGVDHMPHDDLGLFGRGARRHKQRPPDLAQPLRRNFRHRVLPP